MIVALILRLIAVPEVWTCPKESVDSFETFGAVRAEARPEAVVVSAAYPFIWTRPEA